MNDSITLIDYTGAAYTYGPFSAISDDGRPVMNARVMRRAMECARSFGIPVINHCEGSACRFRNHHQRHK